MSGATGCPLRGGLLRHGLLLIDKPMGITSHDVVSQVRRAAGQKRVGHTGTLDPLATGLLAVLLGGATRLEPYLSKMDKTYLGRLELGVSTDTDDITGKILERCPGPWPTLEVVSQALAGRVGEFWQVPPAFSAIKVEGRRAYQAARAGEALELKARLVTAHGLEMVNYCPPFWEFRAEVSTGFYIRSLVRDLGAELGLGGVLTHLRRESVGSWHVSGAIPLDDLSTWTEADWERHLVPPVEILAHLPKVELDSLAALHFTQGRVVKLADQSWASGAQRIISPNGTLLGIGEVVASMVESTTSPQEPFLRSLRVLNFGA